MSTPLYTIKRVKTPSIELAFDFREDIEVKCLADIIFDHGGWIIIRDATSLNDERIASLDSGFYTDNWFTSRIRRIAKPGSEWAVTLYQHLLIHPTLRPQPGNDEFCEQHPERVLGLSCLHLGGQPGLPDGVKWVFRLIQRTRDRGRSMVVPEAAAGDIIVYDSRLVVAGPVPLGYAMDVVNVQFLWVKMDEEVVGFTSQLL